MDEQSAPGQPSTAEVLAEVERRRAANRRLKNGKARRAVLVADRFIFWLSGHWLAVFNALAFLYVGVPFLAPVLMHAGAERPAMIIHTVYRPLCHQLPQRSWFLFGPQFAYRLPELRARLRLDAVPNALAWRFVGSGAVGYKVALCQRCTATYGAILISGLVYGLLRRRWEVRPIPWYAYVGLGILPMAIDGGYQFLSYALSILLPESPISPYETTPLMRVVTGALFGWATIWLAYPYVQETIDEFRGDLHHRFGWE